MRSSLISLDQIAWKISGSGYLKIQLKRLVTALKQFFKWPWMCYLSVTFWFELFSMLVK